MNLNHSRTSESLIHRNAEHINMIHFAGHNSGFVFAFVGFSLSRLNTEEELTRESHGPRTARFSTSRPGSFVSKSQHLRFRKIRFMVPDNFHSHA